MADIVFHFHRNCLSDLPDRLDSLATRQTDAKLRTKITACANTFRGWMKQTEAKIRCERSEESWRWVLGAAKEAGAHTFHEILRLRLHTWETQQEAKAEKRADAKRLAAAMVEFREGGGE
jgi:hypothetical protein